MPFSVQLGSSEHIYIAGEDLNVSMARPVSIYRDIDCGSISLTDYWGCYLDHAPYTNIEIYLPYIGVKSLDTDVILGTTVVNGQMKCTTQSVSVKYTVDITTGACVAGISVDGNIRYTYTGVCGYTLPLTGMTRPGAMQGLAQLIS